MSWKIVTYTFAVLSAAMPLQSCIFEGEGNCGDASIAIAFDWSRADAPTLPEGMATLFYSRTNTQWWRYDVEPTGGKAQLEYGTYTAATFNNDTEGVIVHGYESPNTVVAVSEAGTLLHSARPEFRGSEPPTTDNEPVRRQPGVMYSDVYAGAVSLPPDTALLFHPTRFTPRYSIIIENVRNAASAAETTFSITGLSAGRYIISGDCLPDAVTIPGSLSADGENFTGTMYSFGHSDSARKHILSLYIWLRDGKKSIYTYDVSSFFSDADPAADLTIRVQGPELPEIAEDVKDMQVGVDNWDFVDIELHN